MAALAAAAGGCKHRRMNADPTEAVLLDELRPTARAGAADRAGGGFYDFLGAVAPETRHLPEDLKAARDPQGLLAPGKLGRLKRSKP